VILADHPIALADYRAFEFDDGRWSRTVYRRGGGPAVIVIHEMPGLHPLVVRFAERIITAGMTVYLPSLFGTPGKPVSMGYALGEMLKGVCIRREFRVWANDRSSPIVDWLRALARKAHSECGGRGVGAVGMCFTGGFALGMMLDERMQAPVLSQPSLPFAIGKRHKAAVGISDADLEAVQARAAQGACVLGLRFTGDSMVPNARFDTLRSALGNAFIAVEIDSSKGNPHGIGRTAHSVLSEHFVDEPGHPTYAALERVLAFFEERLRGAATT
jgi:dienelactone hydrolase